MVLLTAAIGVDGGTGDDQDSLAMLGMTSVSGAHRDRYFQNGFFNPAGANALSTFASVPESSDIFSSNNREEGAFNSSAG